MRIITIASIVAVLLGTVSAPSFGADTKSSTPALTLWGRIERLSPEGGVLAGRGEHWLQVLATFPSPKGGGQWCFAPRGTDEVFTDDTGAIAGNLNPVVRFARVGAKGEDGVAVLYAIPHRAPKAGESSEVFARELRKELFNTFNRFLKAGGAERIRTQDLAVNPAWELGWALAFEYAQTRIDGKSKKVWKGHFAAIVAAGQVLFLRHETLGGIDDFESILSSVVLAKDNEEREEAARTSLAGLIPQGSVQFRTCLGGEHLTVLFPRPMIRDLRIVPFGDTPFFRTADASVLAKLVPTSFDEKTAMVPVTFAAGGKGQASVSRTIATELEAARKVDPEAVLRPQGGPGDQRYALEYGRRDGARSERVTKLFIPRGGQGWVLEAVVDTGFVRDPTPAFKELLQAVTIAKR